MLFGSVACCVLLTNDYIIHSSRDGDAVVDAAEVFAVNCVSVNAELVPSCINALVKQFLEISLTPNRQAGSPGEPFPCLQLILLAF